MSEDKSPAKVDPQLVRFEGMQYVRQNYTTSRLSDTEFAELMSSDLKHQYTHAHVREWCRVFNIPNNKLASNEAKEKINTLAGVALGTLQAYTADNDGWVTISPWAYKTLATALEDIVGWTK